MIKREILERIRVGTSAVGYITVRPEECVKEPAKSFFQVLGTGFLVREGTVMTNRHVIVALRQAQKDKGFPDDQKFLQFFYPAGLDNWQQAFCKIQFEGVALNEGVDVGFIEFRGRPEPEFQQQCQALVLGDLGTITLGEAIAALGYPYGTAMLQREGRTYRFGPVLQQGHISAIAPFDDRSQRIDELLLDIRVAGGMSGSAVFRPADGTVIGMVYASWEATTAVAVPVDAKRVTQWLALHDEARSKGPGTLLGRAMDHSVRR